LYKYFAELSNIYDESLYAQISAIVEGNHIDEINTLKLDTLLTSIDSLLGGTSRCLIIPSGETRKEQIEIFHKIASSLEELVTENSNIVLDITHSFRSLPLFTMSVFNYLTEVRHNTIRLDKIVYGRLEDGMIIDVTAAAEFNTWTKAAHAFSEYGKGELLANLLPENEGKAVQSFSDALSLNYVNDITKQIGKLEELLETFDNEIGFLIVPKVIESFINRLKSTVNEASAFQYQLALWHFENKNYNSSYLLLTEGLITKICELENTNWKNKDDRTAAKQLLFSCPNYSKFNRFYHQINQIRNELVHANEQSLGTSTDLIHKLKKCLNEFSQF
jgi:CRISPR-associated DxTHG motif protein